MLKSKNPYFPEVTFLRAFAILAVISIHVSASFVSLKTFNFLTVGLLVINFCSSFAVPLFVFISGFVLFNKYPEIPNLGKFYTKRLFSVVPPYLLFYFASLYLGSFYHLWFFVLIIELYLVYPIVVGLYASCKKMQKSVELVGLVYIVSFLSGLYSPVALTLVVLGYLPYFFLGMYLKDNYDYIRGILRTYLWVLIILAFISIILGSLMSAEEYLDLSVYTDILGFSSAVTLGYCTVAIFICLLLSLQLKSPIMKRIGEASFGIYLVHALILSVLVSFFFIWGLSIADPVFYVLSFSFTLILSLIAVEALQKLPGSKYLIGAKR